MASDYNANLGDSNLTPIMMPRDETLPFQTTDNKRLQKETNEEMISSKEQASGVVDKARTQTLSTEKEPDIPAISPDVGGEVVMGEGIVT